MQMLQHRRSQRAARRGAGDDFGAGVDSGELGAVPWCSGGRGFYFVWALVLGSRSWPCAVGFFFQLSDVAARRLLLASLVYLPAMMGLLVLGHLA